jgi:hypothetical protein
VLSVIAFSACSSSKKSATSDTSPPTAAIATLPPTTARAVSTDPFCNFVRTYNDRFGRINPGALSDPQQFRTVMQDASNAIEEAAANSPAAIKADVTLMSQAVQKLLDAFQKANFDVTRIDVSALNDLATPQFTAAGQRLDAYTRQNCA